MDLFGDAAAIFISIVSCYYGMSIRKQRFKMAAASLKRSIMSLLLLAFSTTNSDRPYLAIA